MDRSPELRMGIKETDLKETDRPSFRGLEKIKDGRDNT